MQELDARAADHGMQDAAVRVRLSPAQFANALGVPLTGEGRLVHVVLITVDVALDGYVLEPFTPGAARPHLDVARYGPLGRTTRTVFEERVGVTRPADADCVLLDRLAESVGVSALRVGPRVLHDDVLAAELLGELLAYG